MRAHFLQVTAPPPESGMVRPIKLPSVPCARTFAVYQPRQGGGKAGRRKTKGASASRKPEDAPLLLHRRPAGVPQSQARLSKPPVVANVDRTMNESGKSRKKKPAADDSQLL